MVLAFTWSLYSTHQMKLDGTCAAADMVLALLPVTMLARAMPTLDRFFTSVALAPTAFAMVMACSNLLDRDASQLGR